MAFTKLNIVSDQRKELCRVIERYRAYITGTDRQISPVGRSLALENDHAKHFQDCERLKGKATVDLLLRYSLK
jgi:hypothetical protein